MEQENGIRREKERRKREYRKKRARKKRIRRLLVVGSLVLTGLVFYFIGNCFATLNAGTSSVQLQEKKNNRPAPEQKEDKTKADEKKEPSAQGQIQEDNGQEQLVNEARNIYRNQEAVLVLVNKERELSSDYDANLSYICNKRLQASADLKSDLTKMFSDAKKAGYTFWIASAWRSSRRQQKLLEAEVNKNIKKGMSSEAALNKSMETVMPAGHSEHETGLALDILCSDNLKMDETQETAGGNIWLREHCAEYGFILRYPKEKVEITHIAYEPWHFRYVGRDAAAFMVQNNLTLEEFYDLIEK